MVNSMVLTSEQLQQRLFVLHLALIEGVGPAVSSHIIKHKPDSYSWDDLYSFTNADWLMMGLSPKSASLVVDGLAATYLLEKELTYIQLNGIDWVTVYDDSYPVLLKHINQPPSVLYFKGAAPATHAKNVAIVGSRAADAYAKRVIESFVPSLVAHGWSIISGGALGADSMAHQATLQAGGKTVAVLGSGLLRPYPMSNRALFEQIVASGGTLISSFPLTVEPMPGNFPARNRIIAGLSSGCIVAQAAYKSGASITAQYALDQGRTVFAVPGMIDNPLSVGCHALLQQGAAVAANVQDILTELGDISVVPVMQQQEIVFKKQPESVSEAKATSTTELTQKAPVPALRYPADSIESRILNLCTKPCSTDEVAQQCAITCADAQHLLFDLQLDGLIQQNFAGQWIVCSIFTRN